METMKIAEIKKAASKKGIEIKKCIFTVNNQPTYKVTHNDGSWRILVKQDLIEAAETGMI